MPRRAAQTRLGWTAALLLASLACASRSSGRAPGQADVVRMTRVEACFQIATEVCRAEGGCVHAQRDGEYACRDLVMHVCCRAEDTCAQPVLMRLSRMSECLRGIRRNYECDKMFTPACAELIPEATARRDAAGGPVADRFGP